MIISANRTVGSKKKSRLWGWNERKCLGMVCTRGLWHKRWWSLCFL